MHKMETFISLEKTVEEGRQSKYNEGDKPISICKEDRIMHKQDSILRRLLSFLMVLTMVVSLFPAAAFASQTDTPALASDGTTVYLKPNSNWLEANARFAAYYFAGDSNGWVSMTPAEKAGYYTASIPAGYSGLIFCRMNPGTTENSWDNKWNQTSDLKVPTDSKNAYVVADDSWGDAGQWTAYGSGESGKTTYYVAGSAGLCGTEWSANGSPMKKQPDGSWRITFANIEAGDYAFKVTDGSWSNSWPDTNYSLTVESKSNVTIAFAPEGKSITVTQTPVAEAPTSKTIYLNPGVWLNDNARFAAKVWIDGGKETDYTLTDADGDLVYEATVPFEANEVQFLRVDPENADNIWNDSEKLTVDGLCYVIQGWDNAAWSDSSKGPDLVVAGEPESVFGTKWNVSNTANTLTRQGVGMYAITYKAVPAGTELAFKVTNGTWDVSWGNGGGNYTYTVKETGDVTIAFNSITRTITVTETGEDAEDGKYHATFHFVNSENWSSVNLYTWHGAGNTKLTGGWPGTGVEQDWDGFYTYTVDYTPEDKNGLNFIFSGDSAQTLDLNLTDTAFVDGKAEKWVRLSGKSGDKFTAELLDAAPVVVVSPKVSGTSVTFAYLGTEATAAVQVQGDWAEAAVDMTEGESNIWSATVEGLTLGDHTYQFLVDGAAVNDPSNTMVIGGKSSFTILDPNAEDTNQITVNVHFTETDGDYAGWNVYFWGTGLDGKGYVLADDPEGGKIFTKVLTDARALTEIGAIVRYSMEGNDWAKQSPDMKADLTDIVSGTIDLYAEYDGTQWTCRTKLGSDIVKGIKLTSVQYDYDTDTLVVAAASKLEDGMAAFTLEGEEGAQEITVEDVQENGKTYTLTLSKQIPLKELYRYKVSFQKRTYAIGMGLVYGSDKFESDYTYEGDDLGAVYTADATTFKLWAPTAERVEVNFYTAGNGGEATGRYEMTLGEKGVWSYTGSGNLDKTYYTYSVTVDGETVEAVDPYARAVGVNGNRAMVVNLSATGEAGSYVTCSAITDAILYEMQIRDYTVNSSTKYPGKYLGVVDQTSVSGVKYLQELGITHVHLLPSYDFGSVDETTGGYNWGYDPKNYNVPEGSYSTDPYNGEVRIREMKTMVKGLHSAGIGVVMDVVYNHVYDASTFSMNQIVPGYFSRENSNGSGCGNDTASERSMVRKYIVDSVTYWASEYHIDGFRFDLVGLIDAETINQVVASVKKVNPNAIFYGEGWSMGTNVPAGTGMATQANASATPGFAYFSDQMRDTLAGNNNGTSLGFVSGAAGQESTIANNILANPSNIQNGGNPTQVVQYASCHDNYTLLDKILQSTGKNAVDSEAVAMNNLAAAIYMTSQGAPFIHSGEEILREKLNADGSRNHNSYNAGDGVNAIVWSNLDQALYKDTLSYYQGLIAFRKAHPALCLTSAAAISQRMSQQKAENGLVSFLIDGKGLDSCDSIYLVFNGSADAQPVTLPAGAWDVCIDKDHAGTKTLRTVSGTVTVPGTSALVLVQQKTQDYYLVGNINNADYGIEGDYQNLGDYKFVNGKLTVTFTSDSYVMVKTGDNLSWYMTNGWLGEGITEATLYNTNTLKDANKLKVAAGTVTFTLTAGENDTLILKVEREDPDAYYLNGYINSADYYGAEYKFVNGTLTARFTADTYLTVRQGETTFYTNGWQGFDQTSATLFPENTLGDGKDKWSVPTGVDLTFTLAENDDGSITLSYTKGELEDPDALYLWGTFDGVDTDDLSCKFVEADGKLQLTKVFTKDSYVAVKNGDGSAKYMTDGYKGAVTSATLYDTGNHTLVNDKFDKLLVPAGEIAFTLVKNRDGSLSLSYALSGADTPFQDETGIQQGVTLHCWNWSFAEIEAHLDAIQAAGYTAIQTSPVQPVKESTANSKVGTHWWVYYQPVDFKINDAAGNALGTKAELAHMISAAHAKGLKVIVDVVANHLANETGNNLSPAIPEYLRQDAYWHDITTNIANWTDRYDMTQHCMDGLPDLNTANKELQGYVLSFLKDCVDLGVDGFRFDAAKSIETPDDDASFASDFWPTVVNGVSEYAAGKGKSLYFYGETLDDIAIAASAYTKYMSITDNGWGNHLRMMLNGTSDTPELKEGYYKSAAASNLVVWAESHDTYADGTSRAVSEEVINKTWALVAARKDAMGLYLARPESLEQKLGVASEGTGWDSLEVAAVNAFHNHFAGKSETVGNSQGVSYVIRGNSGAVLVNTALIALRTLTAEVSVDAGGMADGVYYDQLTGNPFTVKNGTLSGTIGDSGIAVVYNIHHTITVADTTGGSVSASASAAPVHSTVTVTTVPQTGKQVDTVVVTDQKGNTVALTDNGDGTYSFTMPDSNVTVSVTFRDLPPVPAVHTITVNTRRGGKVTAPDTAKTGETVTVKLTADAGKGVKTIAVEDANGDSVKVTEQKNGSFTFVMPDRDVTVTPVFLYNVELDVQKGGEALVSNSTPAYGETVTVKIDPDTGKTVKKITATTESGKTVELTKKTRLKYTFQQPDEDVTVKITFQKDSGNAATGDQSNIWLWVGIMAAALVLLLAVVILLVKNNKKHNR